MSSWTFYMETFGCRVNQQESQELRDAWQSMGGLETGMPEEADYILINSCAITANAEREARNAVYRLRRRSPLAKLILCGCAAQFFDCFQPRKNAFYARPDLCVEQARKAVLLDGPWIAGTGSGGHRDHVSAKPKTRTRPVLKIQDGCTQNCTYCIVPQTRSVPVSLSPQAAAAKCRELLGLGASEIMISGINLRQYGADNPQCGDLWDLLEFLDNELANEYLGRARFRLSSVEPSMLGQKALDTIARLRLLCPHIHLSLQHTSPQVLRRMGRGHYNAGKVSDFLNDLRSIWKNPGIGADLIAGFPGETESDMQHLLDFMDRLGLTYAHVFPYSARQGSAAEKFPGHLPRALRLERASALRNKAETLKERFINSQLGAETLTVAIEQKKLGGHCQGFSENYISCILLSDKHADGLCQCAPQGKLGQSLVVEPKNFDPVAERVSA